MPPKHCTKFVPISVSPGRGSLGQYAIRSTFVEPTTTTFGLRGTQSSSACQERQHGREGRRRLRLRTHLVDIAEEVTTCEAVESRALLIHSGSHFFGKSGGRRVCEGHPDMILWSAWGARPPRCMYVCGVGVG